jgi:ubiquinone/menaquinone biosynthesis C-methylase UbiE
MPSQDRGRVSGDPFKVSPYFEAAERDMDRHWRHYIWRRICHMDFSSVLDLACGYGRNTAKLLPLSSQVIAADINQECIDACRRRLGSAKNLSYLLLDGVSLQGIADGQLSLVYCWDAMVHFEPDVVEAYVAEFARTLRSGGHGFIHHSNRPVDRGVDFRSKPHWRNYMSKAMFREFLDKNRFEVVSQSVIGWDQSALGWRRFLPNPDPNYIPGLDCISVFRKR